MRGETLTLVLEQRKCYSPARSACWMLALRKEEAMAETIREMYIRRNPKSAELYPTFQEVFPTGVSHDMRVTDPFPLVMAHGQGARKWDVDGNEYIRSEERRVGKEGRYRWVR